MKKPPLRHHDVLDVLQSIGPMTSIEVKAFFPLHDQRHVAGALSRLRSRYKVKKVRICDWVPTSAPQVLAPVYEASSLPCKKRPKAGTNADACRAYRQRRKPVRGVASVWDLASAFSE